MRFLGQEILLYQLPIFWIITLLLLILVIILIWKCQRLKDYKSIILLAFTLFTVSAGAFVIEPYLPDDNVEIRYGGVMECGTEHTCSGVYVVEKDRGVLEKFLDFFVEPIF